MTAPTSRVTPRTVAVEPARLELDEHGRLTPESTRAWRAMLRAGTITGARFLAHLDALLGDFDALPATTRSAIAGAIEADTAMRVRGLSLSPWHATLVRAIARVERRTTAPRFRRLLFHVGYALWFGPNAMVRRAHDWRTRTGLTFARRPALTAALIASGTTPQILTADWARGVRVDPRIRAFFSDPAAGSCSGYLLGIDLFPAEDGWYFIEANLNPAIYPDGIHSFGADPLDAVFAFARGRGFRRVAFVWMESYSPGDDILADIASRAAACGLSWTAFVDPRLPSARAAVPGAATARAWFAPPLEAGTLQVSIRQRRVASDYLVNDKTALSRGLVAYCRGTPDAGFYTHLLTADAPDIAPGTPRGPNVVYKYPEHDRGTGVFFLRVRSQAEACGVAADLDRRHGTTPGLFQRYITPRHHGDGRPYHIRALVLCTPLGHAFLGARRYVAAAPLPDDLPWGLLPPHLHLATNQALGNAIEQLTPEQTAECARAALAVARGIGWVLARGFVVAPPPAD